MAAKIFIEGEHGTTGLQIRERLAGRTDIVLLSIPMEERRNEALREQMLKDADIAILCLPDDAAIQAVALAAGSGPRFIDASTAHRTNPHWLFGFAEMPPGQGERIAKAQFVSNPGCYSTGAISIIAPLTAAGLLPADYPVTINAVSGYTGGGKAMIAQMEEPARDDAIHANHFAYGLTLAHKHVPEIMMHGGLTRRPVFTPAGGRFAQGMLVHVPLHGDSFKHGATLADIHVALSDHYAGQAIVTVAPLDALTTAPRIDATEMTGTDAMKIYVTGHADGSQIDIIASLDNLGKGASGAAVQNLDLMIGA